MSISTNPNILEVNNLRCLIKTKFNSKKSSKKDRIARIFVDRVQKIINIFQANNLCLINCNVKKKDRIQSRVSFLNECKGLNILE